MITCSRALRLNLISGLKGFSGKSTHGFKQVVCVQFHQDNATCLLEFLRQRQASNYLKFIAFADDGAQLQFDWKLPNGELRLGKS